MTIEIGTAAFGEPPAERGVTQEKRQLLDRIGALEQGEYLPATCDSPNKAQVLITWLRKRGFEVKRSGTTLFILAPDTATAHQHRWVYPPGADGSVDAACRCGARKDGVEPTPVAYGGAKTSAQSSPVCGKCGNHPRSHAHRRACDGASA